MENLFFMIGSMWSIGSSVDAVSVYRLKPVHTCVPLDWEADLAQACQQKVREGGLRFEILAQGSVMPVTWLLCSIGFR
jgi:hypothetical protein